MPAGYTDQAQPIDDGAGRQYKIYVGQEEDAWLEDDDNLRKWENNELTTSNRRILLAHWYCAAHKRVVESRAIRKYFEHTGALLTADGTDDDLIKLEGMPKGHKFTWVDDDDAQPFEPTPSTAAPDPPDVGPLRESEGEGVSAEASNYVEDDSDGDDEDEDDAPPAPRTTPAGFTIASSPTFSPAALTPKAPEQEQLVGRSILYHWPSVGWCVGLITEANRDGRRTIMIDGTAMVANFFVHYEIDGETPKHCLMLEQYGGEDTHCWVLL